MTTAHLVHLVRATSLALVLLIGSINSAFAHALPGSILIFWQTGQQINVSIRLPLEDLVVAYPASGDLLYAPLGESLTTEQTDLLAGYLKDHTELRTPATELPLELADATVALARNEDVGLFRLLVVQLRIPLPEEGESFPLSLTYDFVMHEVRSHRAAVVWAQPGEVPRIVAEFGYQPVQGEQQPVSLSPS